MARSHIGHALSLIGRPLAHYEITALLETGHPLREGQRKRNLKLLRLIGELDPDAFRTISDIKRRPIAATSYSRTLWSLPEWLRVVKKKEGEA